MEEMIEHYIRVQEMTRAGQLIGFPVLIIGLFLIYYYYIRPKYNNSRKLSKSDPVLFKNGVYDIVTQHSKVYDIRNRDTGEIVRSVEQHNLRKS